MGVLHVVDRQLAGLLVVPSLQGLAQTAHLLDVEVDARGRSTRRKEPACGIHADLGQELVEGDERRRHAPDIDTSSPSRTKRTQE